MMILGSAVTVSTVPVTLAKSLSEKVSVFDVYPLYCSKDKVGANRSKAMERIFIVNIFLFFDLNHLISEILI